jgi:ferritin
MNDPTDITLCEDLPAPADARSQISSTLLEKLNRQLNHEFFASHSYLALAAWCDARHLQGLANFFRQQSAEELEHAMRVFDYLLDRGAEPEISDMRAPRATFASLVEAAGHAQNIEVSNSRGVHEAYQTALQESDYPTQVMLQWFIQEQVEEEKWAEELVAKAQMAGCSGAMFMLDHRYAKRVQSSTTGQAAQASLSAS